MVHSEPKLEPIFLFLFLFFLFLFFFFSFFSALQPWVGLGLPNDPPPLIPISRLLHPSTNSHSSLICDHILQPSYSRSSYSSRCCYFLHFTWLHHCSYIYHSPLYFSRSSPIYPSCPRLLGFLTVIVFLEEAVSV